MRSAKANGDGVDRKNLASEKKVKQFQSKFKNIKLFLPTKSFIIT